MRGSGLTFGSSVKCTSGRRAFVSAMNGGGDPTWSDAK